MQNDVLQPNETNFGEIGVNSLGAFIAGLSGSILLFVLVLVSASFVDIAGEFSSEAGSIRNTNFFFPFFLSFITFLVTELVIFFSHIFLSFTSPDKYKRTAINFGQIALLSILTYVFITPVYIYAGMADYNNIIYVFIGHILFLFFSVMIVQEILSNYRYILVGLYAAVVSVLLSGLLTFIIFGLVPEGTAKIIALLLLLPLVNFMCIFFKGLFEYVYYMYYKHTGSDNLGDIFRQLELEAEEQLKQATEENSI